MTPLTNVGRDDGRDVGGDVHEHLAAARLRMSTDFPYYAHGLFALQPVMAPGLDTLAVDPSWRLYVDPKRALSWSVAELGAVLVHELHHLLRDHVTVATQLGVTDERRGLWNVAADCAINDDLLAEHLRLPKGAVVPATIGQPDGELEEIYYDALQVLDAATKEKLDERGGAGFRTSRGSVRSRTGCGSGADGVPRDWDLGAEGDGAPGLSEVDAVMVRRKVAVDVVEHQKSRGNLPAGLTRWATALLHPVVDWRQVLKSELRSARTWVAGNTHTTYSRADRRADCRPEFVFPGTHQPSPDVAVVVDTSGSMTEDELGTALAELESLLRQLAVRELWVLSCDAIATPPQRVRRIDSVDLIGGGGTDMRVGIEAASVLRPRPSLIVVFTDGETPWPTEAPDGTRVVAVVISADAPLPKGRGISAVRVHRGARSPRDGW